MKKLILIHDQDEYLLANLTHIFVHHIRCPLLFFISGTSILKSHHDPVTEMDVSTTSVVDKERHRVVFVSNDPFLCEHIDGYVKKFDIFNVYTDMVIFSQNKHRHGVWLGALDETIYAFNQLIPWVYDV